MGMRADIQTDVGAAFDNDLADAVQPITLKKIESNYDVDTSVDVPTETSYTSRGVEDELNIREIFNEAVINTDFMLIVLANELAAEPEVDDLITIGSKDSKIIAVKMDPAKAAWNILCRR